MTATHTPGPWFVPLTSESRGGSGRTSVWALGGDILIAESPSRSLSLEGRRANARLIAAAPDLFEALQLALETFESPSTRPSDEYHAANSARAALAKATGSQTQSEGETPCAN